MASTKPAMVHCRYPKCFKLHETTELLKENAVQGGKSYYHPDCYHTMQTTNEIRDLFYKNVNPLMTKSQVGALVSIIHKIVFDKHVDIDFLKFALQYFIDKKPGKLNYPQGLHYIIQDRDVVAAWNRNQEAQIKAQFKKELQEAIQKSKEKEPEDIDLPEITTTFKNKRSRFSSVIGA